MSGAAQRLYDLLPPLAQSGAASLRGFYLRAWRYGAETERLVAEAEERESWTESRWRAWQEERMGRLLRRAATQVPFYRQQWEERRRKGDRATVERLENWPILRKETLRERAVELVADDRDRKKLFAEQTSGTTGTPLRLWISRRNLRAAYALFEARVRRWNGISLRDRWAMLGGQLVTPTRRTRPPYWVWNAGLNQLYMSSYHLSQDTAGDYLAAMRRFRVTSALGYPSSLHSLAQAAIERGLDAPRLSVVIGNAEPLYESQRAAISRAFGAPVRNTYGMAEWVGAASECSAGTLHAWPEAGVLETLQDDSDAPAALGQPGRLIGTGLINDDMPLIRYEIGDRASLAVEGDPCPCGRSLPALDSVEGRCDDVVITPAGRRIGRFDPVFKADLPIREAQIIQETLQRLRVHVVLSVPPEQFDPAELVARLRARVGPGMELIVQTVDRIPRTSRGKFRAVVSQLKPTKEAGAAWERAV